MPNIQTTQTINFNETVLVVSQLDPQLQQIVATYDEWRQKLVDAEQEVLILRAALTTLQNELLTALTKAQEEAAKAQEEAEVKNEEAPTEE